jgi:two-component system catabolic regulation response regulator CreB/two-component system response regulator ChvI
MLVDDNKDILTTFEIGLKEYGFDVDGFNNPFEAVAKFKASDEKTYDLLLIDLIFGEPYNINGFQIYQQMRDSGITLPCVCFITGFPDYYDTLKPLSPEIDVRCFIRKPIEIIDLAARLKQEMRASQ